MSFNQSGTFIYSPDISVVIDSVAAGPMDVSADVMNFTVDREMNAVSSFNCTLNNPGRKYNFGMPNQISTMDRITVFLKRTQWVQVFTGYVTYAPIETLVPTPIQITANCTLRILQVTYWDDTLVKYQSLLLNFMDKVARSTQQTLNDGGVATAVVNMLYGVCGWNPDRIHIQNVPDQFINYAAQAYTRMLAGEQLNQNAVQDLANILNVNKSRSQGSSTDLSTTSNTSAPDKGIGVSLTANQARGFLTSPIAGGKANFPGPNTMNPVNDNLITEDIFYCSAPWSFLQYQVTDKLTSEQKKQYQTIQDNAKTWLMNNPSTFGADGRIIQLYSSNNLVVNLRATSIPQKANQSLKGYAVYDPTVDYIQVHPGVAAYLNGKISDPTKWNSTEDPGPITISTSWPDPTTSPVAGVVVPSKTDQANANSTYGGGTTLANSGLLWTEAVNKLIYVLAGQLGDAYTQKPTEYDGRQVTRMTPATAYGAKNGAFDCSGLAYWAYQQIGINLHGSNTTGECGPLDGSLPDTYGIWSDKNTIPTPGALIFWNVIGEAGPLPNHVSILIGGFGQQPPLGVGLDNIPSEPGVGWAIESSTYGVGPHIQKLFWPDMVGGKTIFASKGYAGQQYIGARSPLTLINSWTGAQATSLLNTDYNSSTSTTDKATTLNPNDPQQRATINLAKSYNNLFGMPQFDPRSSSMLGTPRAFLLDNPVMQDLTQIMQGGMRSYMSAPNGDFVAWFPDYYGIYGTDPVLDISPVEIIDFQIYHDDNQLATHVGIVGDTNGVGQQVSNADYLTTNGIVSIQDATTMSMLFGSQSLSEPTTKQNTLSAATFLDRYGMRPYVNEQNMIHSLSLEYIYALYTFMQQWTNQYVSNVTFTFMPELYPGMRVSMNVTDETATQNNYMFYVSSVIHTGDRSGGFTTQATLTAPMKNGKIMSYGLNLA